MQQTLLSRASVCLFGFLLITLSAFTQVTEKWVKRQNGDANTQEKANALAIDQQGNIIVTGIGDGDNNNIGKWVTVKYNDNGDAKWVKRYSGPANSYDEPKALATDYNGNIYITGTSGGIGTGADITTIKYDVDGHPKWVKRYNGPNNLTDVATAIAIDTAGNVYVTGYSEGIGTGRDLTTIKYDVAGNTKWVKHYNGPNNTSDEGAAIAIDENGNVYVTGYSAGIGTGGDMTTIMYNANGNQQWINRFNGPVNKFDGAIDLGLDHNGNVYVTGYANIGEFDETDVLTIKYNSSGQQQWANYYSGGWFDVAREMEVDPSGNVYIALATGPPDDESKNSFITIKYNTAGILQWEAIYDGPGYPIGGSASSLVLDTTGNVYVTGNLSMRRTTDEERDYVTIKYNTNGVQQWFATYNDAGNGFDRATAIGVDKTGNVYITGISSIDLTGFYDYATIKYDAAGEQKWVERLNGTNDQVKGGYDASSALVLDKSGNVYVTGGMTRLNTGMDYTTYKYDPDANRLWKKTFNGLSMGPDMAKDITVDNQGNVYVTGLSDDGDYATVKYDKDGETKWVKRYDGPTHALDEPTAIAVDDNGNVYVTGRSAESLPGFRITGDYLTIKYDAAGNTKWIQRYDGPGQDLDRAVAMAVDKLGNVYVTGQSTGSGTNTDIATIKYDTNGNQQWLFRHNGGVNGNDYAQNIAIDAAGYIYVTGVEVGSSGTNDFITIKYSSSGSKQWTRRYQRTSSSNDIPYAIAVDAAGNIYVTGHSIEDYATVKYNSAGVQQWAVTYDNGNYDAAASIALDAQGNIYITGNSRDNTGLYPDIATVKYNPSGVQQWVARYNGPAVTSGDGAVAVAVDSLNNVYVAGVSGGIGTSYDYVTIKYEQTTDATAMSANRTVQKNITGEQEAVKLTAKAFPNAFTESINLQWRGPNKPVTITTRDITGRVVEKRSGLAPNGSISMGDSFKPGIYFAEIMQGDQKLVLKLVKK